MTYDQNFFKCAARNVILNPSLLLYLFTTLVVFAHLLFHREVKDRQKAAKKTAALAARTTSGSTVPKVQKGSAANSRGGSRR